MQPIVKAYGCNQLSRLVSPASCVHSRVLVPQVLQHLLLSATATHAVVLPLAVKLPAAGNRQQQQQQQNQAQAAAGSAQRHTGIVCWGGAILTTALLV
jgi:hypothetical protein